MQTEEGIRLDGKKTVANRDSQGRFVAGNQAAKGAGRPPKAREERYYEITINTCTFADWERIIQKAVEQAKRGDHTARKFLADYLVGVPAQDHNIYGEIGTFDLDAWKRVEQEQLDQIAQLEE